MASILDWIQAAERETMQKTIDAQEKIIESLRTQLAVQESVNGWSPCLVELLDRVEEQKKTIEALMRRLEVVERPALEN